MSVADYRFDMLDDDHITAAARFAARSLSTWGVARVRVCPGDMTEYKLLIAAPGIEFVDADDERPGQYYWVALCAGFGAGYEWHGRPTDGGYAAEKWTNRGAAKAVREWAGEVVARFLTALSHEIGARS